MKKIRIIHYVYKYGEGVYFTENLDYHANDFIPSSASVESETIVEMNVPFSFPLNREFETA